MQKHIILFNFLLLYAFAYNLFLQVIKKLIKREFQ